MQQRQFKQIDVFTSVAYRGNPLAVVLDAEGLSDQEMQRFAQWTNLSETTFLLPPTAAQADYRVRIFTPESELPFAGHPTLGSAHAWLQAGGRPKAGPMLLQECQKGLIPIRQLADRLAFAAPAVQSAAITPELRNHILAALGLNSSQLVAAQWLDNGPQWHALLLDTVDTVLGLKPNHQRLKELNVKVGVAAIAPSATAPALHVRGFVAPVGVPEDPVTGSLNASLGQWLIAERHMPQRYVAHQGAALGRDGRVFIERDDAGQVWVGGSSVTCIEGRVQL